MVVNRQRAHVTGTELEDRAGAAVLAKDWGIRSFKPQRPESKYA